MLIVTFGYFCFMMHFVAHEKIVDLNILKIMDVAAV